MSPRKNIGSDVLIGFEVVNGELVRQGLENFANSIPKVGRLRIYRFLQKIYARLGIYPAPRPHQRYMHKRSGYRSSKGRARGGRTHEYKRTYNLRNSRALEKTDLGYVLRNDPVDKYGTHYGVYVRGNPAGEGQAGHNRDWLLLARMIEIEMARLPKEVVEALTIELIKEQNAANTGLPG